MWDTVKKFFKRSETIFLARLYVFLGAILEVISQIDPYLLYELFSPRWLPVILIAHGFLVEWARRRNATELEEPETAGEE